MTVKTAIHLPMHPNSNIVIEVSKHGWELLHFANLCSSLLCLTFSLQRFPSVHSSFVFHFSWSWFSIYDNRSHLYGNRARVRSLKVHVEQTMKKGRKKKRGNNTQANSKRMLSEIENVWNISFRIGFGVYCVIAIQCSQLANTVLWPKPM